MPAWVGGSVEGLRLKVIDFGLCTGIPPAGTLLPPSSVGKQSYKPPEFVQPMPYDPVKVDVWTLGIML